MKDERKKEVAQDSDVKDKAGTQPKKYFAGLPKKTKERRDAHFKKGAKMDDNNPDAYKPAPGDADAKTKPSKYTLKYKKMYGEDINEAFDKPYKFNLTKDSGGYTATALLPDKTKLEVLILDLTNGRNYQDDYEFFIKRYDDRGFEGKGDAMRVVATVIEMLKKFIKTEKHINTIHFSVPIPQSKRGTSQVNIYRRLLKKYLPKSYEMEIIPRPDLMMFYLKNNQYESPFKATITKYKGPLTDSVDLASENINEELEGLKKKAEKSGISYSILKKVYDRGVAAWRTGHRPGTTPQQWGYARVNSFITGGKTRTTADADLAKKIRKESLGEQKTDKESKGNPVAKYMNKYNKSNVQTDKKKEQKKGYMKHKTTYTEMITFKRDLNQKQLDEGKLMDFITRLFSGKKVPTTNEKMMDLITQKMAQDKKFEDLVRNGTGPYGFKTGYRKKFIDYVVNNMDPSAAKEILGKKAAGEKYGASSELPDEKKIAYNLNKLGNMMATVASRHAQKLGVSKRVEDQKKRDEAAKKRWDKKKEQEKNKKNKDDDDNFE